MIIPPFYSIEVFNPDGTVVDTIDNPVSLTAARSYVNEGNAVLTLLPQHDEEFFRYNMRFKLWRTDSAHGKSLFGDTIWFLRKFTNQVSQGRFVVEMVDALSILSNALVAYTAETMYADKTLESFDLITYTDAFRIDNMMRQYVRENLSSDAEDSARINPYIRVEQDLNLAPYGEKTAAWAKLNDVLRDLSRMSAEKGMELFYDLLPQDNNILMFKVWKGVRSNDRGFSSANSVVFTDDDDDLYDIQVTYDYSNMGTYCYVLGYDTGPSQIVQEVGNSDIIRSDPFGRVEFTHNDTENDEASVLLANGQAALHGLRPRRVLSAKLSPASSLRYGSDFAYGDRVGVQVGGRQYDCQISAVKADWQAGRERLEIRLDGSESLWNAAYWQGSDYTPAPIVVPDPSYAPQPEPEPEVWPPPFGDPSIFYGDMQGYVLWDGAHVFRTTDLQAPSPVWELIDSGIDGSIRDCQYVMVDENTVGAWLMTSTGIWWCDDIQAVTPTWTEVLAVETVQAADATPASGTVTFKCMFHYWSAPGHLCVATGPQAGDATNTTYAHAYFWVTEDYGANWTQVDMNSFLYGGTRGFCYSSLYAMNIFRSDPGTIYCIRSAPQSGLNSKTQVFLSTDLGYTWTEGDVLHEGSSTNLQVYSLLNPFPDATDPSYAVQGGIGASNRPSLWVSTDEWANSSEIAKPSGYGGFSNLWRPNKRTFDNLHILAWLRNSSENQMHLMESNDGGSSWSLLHDSGMDDTTIDNVGTGGSGGNVVNVAQHNTPNGWPPDVNQWVMILASGTSLTNRVQLTLDNFANLSDKTGNLSSLVGAWVEGPANGFALPRVGSNAGGPITPDVLMPKWGILHDGVTEVQPGADVSLELVVSSTNEGAISSGDYYLLLAPPTNAVRIKISGTWSETRTCGPGSVSFVGYSGAVTNPTESNQPNALTTIDTLSKVTAPTVNGGPLTGDFVIEWTRNVGQTDWEFSRDDMLSSSPTIPNGYARIYMSATANSADATRTATEELSLYATVTEIELEDGYIYTPL